MERLLEACKHLKYVQDNKDSYDDFEYNFTLEGAVDYVVSSYEAEVERLEMMNVYRLIRTRRTV